MRVLAISDTHVPTIAQKLPEKILEEAASSNMIIHAGDLVSKSVLDQLSTIRQVHAVRGNMDSQGLASLLPRTRTVVIGKWRVGIVHGHEGRGSDTPIRALNTFPIGSVDCIVFGHSHVPISEEREGILLFNPGSPVAGRGSLGNTYGILEAEATLNSRIVQLSHA